MRLVSFLLLYNFPLPEGLGEGKGRQSRILTITEWSEVHCHSKLSADPEVHLSSQRVQPRAEPSLVGEVLLSLCWGGIGRV
jgi:hypothetical protein